MASGSTPSSLASLIEINSEKGCNIGIGIVGTHLQVPMFDNCCSNHGNQLLIQLRLWERYAPSVESTIVPSKSESTPSNECTCGGAEKVPVAEGDMAGAG